MSFPGFSLRLTHKITVIGAIGVVGVVLVGGMHMYGESGKAVYQAAADNARKIFELNNKIDIKLLETRRAEKDFLLRNDAKRAESQIEISKSVESDIDVLRGNVVAVGKPDLARQIDAMAASLRKYQTHFTSAVEAKRELGLDEKAGLEGRLRTSVHDIESRFDQLHEAPLLVTMLTMRRHEKDFMLRRDPKYGDEMKKRASEFTAQLEKANIPEAAKTELKQKLADYQRDFFAWMNAALKIAAELKATSDSFAAVEPVVEAISREINGIRTEAEQSSAALSDNIDWQMKIAIMLIMSAALGAGFFIGRSVSKPLSAMTAAMIELAKGNFAIVLPGLGRKDEIGEIAQAVETFKVNAELRNLPTSSLRRLLSPDSDCAAERTCDEAERPRF